MSGGIVYKISPPPDDVGFEEINALFHDSWPTHERVDFEPILERSLAYVCAHRQAGALVGFVNVAWDGGVHAFLLDTADAASARS